MFKYGKKRPQGATRNPPKAATGSGPASLLPRQLPGWLLLSLGMALGLFLAFVLLSFWQPWQPWQPPKQAAAANNTPAGSDPASPVVPRDAGQPQFCFYTLLPNQKSEWCDPDAANAQASTATSATGAATKPAATVAPAASQPVAALVPASTPAQPAVAKTTSKPETTDKATSKPADKPKATDKPEAKEKANDKVASKPVDKADSKAQEKDNGKTAKDREKEKEKQKEKEKEKAVEKEKAAEKAKDKLKDKEKTQEADKAKEKAKPVSAPEAAKTKDDTARYTLQAGSFKSRAEAEKRRAQVVMLGQPARLQEVRVKEGEVWYRVVIGPLTGKTTSQQAQSHLRSGGVDSLMIRQDGK